MGPVRKTKPRQKSRAKGKQTKHFSDEVLYDYWQKALPQPRRLKIEAHLENCRKCARVAREVALLLVLVRGWLSKPLTGKKLLVRKAGGLLHAAGKGGIKVTEKTT